MKRLLENHPLKNRRIRSKETGKVYGIQDVYHMDAYGNEYITLLTFINGSVAPEFRSHSQIDWEMLALEEGSDLGTHWKKHIEDNRKEFELVDVEDEAKFPISDA